MLVKIKINLLKKSKFYSMFALTYKLKSNKTKWNI